MGNAGPGRPARADEVRERGRVGNGDPHRPLLGLWGGFVFWLVGLQIQETHRAGPPLVRAVSESVSSDTAVVAKIAVNAASHLSGVHLQNWTAGSI